MKNRLSFALASLAIAVATGTIAIAATPQDHSAQVNLTMAQAKAKALHVAPGKISSQELETETGGSGLRYTFDIATQSGTHEVGIDAKTGAVLENTMDEATSEQNDGD